MNENSTVEELLNQCSNTKYLVGKITKAAYGVTIEELIEKLMEKGDRNHE